MYVRCLLALLATSDQKFFILHVQLQAWSSFDVLNLATEQPQLARFDTHVSRQIRHERVPQRTEPGWPRAGARLRHRELLHLAGDALFLALGDVLTHRCNEVARKVLTEQGHESEAALAETTRRIVNVRREDTGRKAVRTME